MNKHKQTQTDGLITNISSSQCISEEENFILRVTWNALFIERNEISDQKIENTLISLLDQEFQDYILEVRNYKRI